MPYQRVVAELAEFAHDIGQVSPCPYHGIHDAPDPHLVCNLVRPFLIRLGRGERRLAINWC